MNLLTKGLRSASRSGAFIALLMSSAATAAMAAPKTHKHAAKAPAVDPRDAKMAAMQQQIDEMRAADGADACRPRPRTERREGRRPAAAARRRSTTSWPT